MTSESRNGPCPCGSGKKQKKCCGGPTQTRIDGFPLGEERNRLVSEFVRFMERTLSENDREVARESYFGDRLTSTPRAIVDRVVAEDMVQINFVAYLLYDADHADAGNLLERFLAARGARFTSSTRRYFEALGRSRLGLYEVEEVVLDEGLLLRDLVGGETIRVRERAATRGLVRWDVLATRVLREPGDLATLVGDTYPFGSSHKQPLLDALKQSFGYEEFTPTPEELAEDARSFGPFFFQAWWDLRVHPPLPKLTNFDGHELIWSETFFDVNDRDAVVGALAKMPELETGEQDHWTWVRREGEERTVLGHIELRGGALILATNSIERAHVGRSLLEGRVGAALRYRIEKTEDARARLERQRAEGKGLEPQAPSVRPEEMERLRLELLDQHYKKWVDQPVPRLDGRTPRHAARLKTQRQRVVDLLKEMENHEAHAGLRGEVPYDFGWVWAELRLERPGRPEQRVTT